MLKKLWLWLFGGCDHEWVILESRVLVNDEREKSLPTGRVFYLKCKKCGDVKRRVLS